MASAYPIPEDQGSVVSVGAGADPDFHATLLEQLESAGIRYSDKVLGDDEVAPTADPLPIDWKPRFGFEVAVLSADLAAARAILETPGDLTTFLVSAVNEARAREIVREVTEGAPPE